jgi:uracil-DNA glycosylase
MSYLQIKECRTFPPGWKKFFHSNWELISDILLTLHGSQYRFAPDNHEIFHMLYEMRPEDIRVVIVGQSPYADGNACGIPFVTKNGNTKTLQNIAKELSRQYRYPSTIKDVNEVVMRWIDEGVFMMNMSFSIGIRSTCMRECDEYVLNHDILWEEFVRNLVKYIARKEKIPILLLGSVAWGLEDEIMSTYNIIKVPLPTRDEFIGSGVFGKCDEFVEINWV